MALNHVNQCDCPIGNCFCSYAGAPRTSLWYNPKTNEFEVWKGHFNCEPFELVKWRDDGLMFIENESWE